MTAAADNPVYDPYAPSPLDAATVDPADWPKRPLGPVTGFRDGAFQVVFRQRALDQIHLHGQSRRDVEVCGVLVGDCYRDGAGLPYLLVEHAIAGANANSASSNVTFTAETWQHIQEEMDRDHADRRMVGWYHTHPGFGIFLSDMDRFICDNFFNLPWQAAFVYDPVGGDEGDFVWRVGRPTRESFLVEDDVTPKAAAVPLIGVADAMAGKAVAPGVDAAKVTELLVRVRRLEQRQKLLVVAVTFLTAFVAMWAYQYGPLQGAMPGAATKPATVPAQPQARRPRRVSAPAARDVTPSPSTPGEGGGPSPVTPAATQPPP